MKKMLLASAVVVAILGIGGCGDSPKSVEELQKLSKEELDSMYKECKTKLDEEAAMLMTTEKGLKQLEEMEDKRKEIEKAINKARGKDTSPFDLFSDVWYGKITDDELAKFGDGNKDFKKMVECGRIYIASKGGLEEFNKPRPSAAERYKNVGKDNW